MTTAVLATLGAITEVLQAADTTHQEVTHEEPATITTVTASVGLRQRATARQQWQCFREVEAMKEMVCGAWGKGLFYENCDVPITI